MNKQVEKLYKNLDLGIKILKKQYSAILSKRSLNFNSFTRSQQLHKKILECKTFYYSGNRKILDTFCNDFSDIFKMLKVPQNSAALLLQTIDTNETKKTTTTRCNLKYDFLYISSLSIGRPFI